MQLYDLILRRKSVRKYDPDLHVSEEELRLVRERLALLTPLDPAIRVSFNVVRREETTCKFGEYCLLFYSEKADGYLENLGYLGEQMDLYLASLQLGACWYGFGRTPERKRDGLPFAIMITFGKCRDTDFRQDAAEVTRKKLDETAEGACVLDALEIARYAPSACNSQPWRIKSEPGRLEIYRTTRIRSALAPRLIAFYNLVDMGIYLYVLELALAHFGYAFTRAPLAGEPEGGRIPVAAYTLKKAGE